MSYYCCIFNLAFASCSANYLLCTNTCTDPNCWEVWSDKWALPVKDNIEIHVLSAVLFLWSGRFFVYISEASVLICHFIFHYLAFIVSILLSFLCFAIMPCMQKCENSPKQYLITLNMKSQFDCNTFLYLKLTSSGIVTATALDAVISHTSGDGVYQ